MSTSCIAAKPLIITADEAFPIRPFGLDMQVLLTTEDTGGAISIISCRHQPGEGPPDHLHHAQEECIFVAEGEYEVVVGGNTRTVGPGTIIFIPRGVVHRFKNIGTTIGRMLDWSLPGGQDRYFQAISKLAADGGFSNEKALQLSEQYDTHFPAAH